MVEICVFTVGTLSSNCAAISLLERPRDIPRKTCVCRGENEGSLLVRFIRDLKSYQNDIRKSRFLTGRLVDDKNVVQNSYNARLAGTQPASSPAWTAAAAPGAILLTERSSSIFVSLRLRLCEPFLEDEQHIFARITFGISNHAKLAQLFIGDKAHQIAFVESDILRCCRFFHHGSNPRCVASSVHAATLSADANVCARSCSCCSSASISSLSCKLFIQHGA